MTKFFLILTENNKDSIESLLNIIQPVVRDITPIINTLEYDNNLIQPVLYAIVNIGILIGKIGLYCPDVVSLAIPDLMKFAQDALDTLQSNPTVHINPTISPIYYSLYDTFKPLNWQMPASHINFRDMLDTSLWLKLTFFSVIKEIYPSLKFIINRNYLNSIVPETNFIVHPVHTRYVRIQRTGHRIQINFTRLFSTIYNNPIQDITLNTLQDGFILQVNSEFFRGLNALQEVILQADPVFSRGPYQLPADSERLFSDIDYLSTLITDLNTYTLPVTRDFFQSIAALSSTLNQYNEVRVSDLIEDIQDEWRRNDINGSELFRIIRILRALESAYKIFHPNFVSRVDTLWFETI